MSAEQSKIPGRTVLTPAQVGLIANLDRQHAQSMQLLQGMKTNPDVDQRSLAVAITNAETAHMWAVRSVAKPSF